MKKLKAGFGRTEITPASGVRLGGYGVEKRPAEEVLDPLHCTCMVLEQDNIKTAILNLDWLAVEELTVNRLRKAIRLRTEIPEEQITVCATHTHSAPNTLDFWGWGELEQEYINEVTPAIAQAVELADQRLQEVSVGFAETESLVGVNRRGIREDGGLGGFKGSPHDTFDPTMTVVHFKNGSRDAGILIHYGAHCTAMGQNRMVSRDWCGIMKDRVESQFEAPVVFLNGAVGDVGPRSNKRLADGLSAGGGDGIHAVREVGYRTATDAVRALISIKDWRNDLKLKLLTEPVFFPYAPLLPLNEARKGLAKWQARKDEWGKPMCEYKYHQAVIEAHQHHHLKGRDFIQTITAFGPLAIVPMPGEMFAGISLRIRDGSPYKHTLCCSTTNGSLAYLPTREARHRGGYETWVGRACGPYLPAENIDDVLVAENLALLRKNFG